jgi:hypothetical protein
MIFGKRFTGHSAYSLLYEAVPFSEIVSLQQLKELLVFKKAKKFITVFTISRHISYAEQVEYNIHSHTPFNISLNLILPSTLRSPK